jgi:hypothetical protein
VALILALIVGVTGPSMPEFGGGMVPPVWPHSLR